MIVQHCPKCGEDNYSSVPLGSCWNCKGSLMSVVFTTPPALTETEKMQLASEVELQHEKFVRQFFPRARQFSLIQQKVDQLFDDIPEG